MFKSSKRAHISCVKQSNPTKNFAFTHRRRADPLPRFVGVREQSGLYFNGQALGFIPCVHVADRIHRRDRKQELRGYHDEEGRKQTSHMETAGPLVYGTWIVQYFMGNCHFSVNQSSSGSP
jgi:hypothetical protein